MDYVEDASAIRQRHKRSGGAIRDVHVKKGGAYLELAETEASLGISAKISEFRVKHLLTSHIFQVD